MAAPEEYITVMNKFHQHNTTCAPSFVQAAAIAALTQEGDEVKEMVKEYQRRRDYAVQAINDIDGIHCLCPKGAFYIFINCKELGKSSAELSHLGGAVPVFPGGGQDRPGARRRVRPRRGGLSAHVLRRQL